MKHVFTTLLLAGLAFGSSAVLTTAGPAHAADGETIDAFLAWSGKGHTYEVGVDRTVFVGALVGPIYVDTEHGLVPSGGASCPVMVDINTSTAEQSAEGHCLIENVDGDRVYADISCTGVFRIGCEGTITLTGGTGIFEGVTGTGAVIVRSERQSFVDAQDGVRHAEGAGIMSIKGLTYTTQ
ncbi:MAG: hypothetical protein SGJ07_02150 [Rhodospirillaceae bacterium]|nr:hypothetical protein [Rhodospirillaceae bacterium]